MGSLVLSLALNDSEQGAEAPNLSLLKICLTIDVPIL